MTSLSYWLRNIAHRFSQKLLPPDYWTLLGSWGNGEGESSVVNVVMGLAVVVSVNIVGCLPALVGLLQL